MFLSGPEDTTPLTTGSVPGALTSSGASWTLQLFPESAPCITRLFSNGCSISARKKPEKSRVEAFLVAPGILSGTFSGLPAPALGTPDAQDEEPGLTWIEREGLLTLLFCKEDRFSLVTGELSKAQALRKAGDALDEDFDLLLQQECLRRASVSRLFSINPRHNPPVALSAESLIQRLRNRTASIHGLWSMADGFEAETFSLNELHALVHAWALIKPDTAMELIRTALSLQQSSGGFPGWVDANGIASISAPWPLIIQSFEQAWECGERDPLELKKALPALRKYMQWALRYFDPHRDGIPSWQSEQEIFIPESFERDKATTELTVMLLAEMEALIRLFSTNDPAETATASLEEQHNQLERTLTTIFWNPEKKSFSNAWKNGHFSNEPSFGSFLPLLLKNADPKYRSPLLEKFEETRGFPGSTESGSWKQEPLNNTDQLPAIHQFMAFEALRNADSGRNLLMLFVRRVREGFTAWFERESIEAARLELRDQRSGGKSQKTALPTSLLSHSTLSAAYSLGPLTAALILTTQSEFQRETGQKKPLLDPFLKGIHRLRIDRSDVRVIMVLGIAIVMVHLSYNLPHIKNTETRMAEAAVNYKQGRFTETLNICRRYPDHVLSRFLRANLLMITENPAQAEELYHQALLQETGSPSALFGYALALQLNGKHEQAIRRYNDFIDIYEAQLSVKGREDLVDLAYEFLRLADEEFSKPPNWKRVYTHSLMNNLGL